ncbi:TPT-domain-containing protein [Teratosphaeria nubilosa]|uniref:TPT-domain-containing protein n=1 Tax=Teratosphaeria nubilosa TaxID=161662 RepID=A0A6G1LIZ0_9PEZI|nr:TPT-domain-containing protein [Teratosphaeria nubilosa]
MQRLPRPAVSGTGRGQIHGTDHAAATWMDRDVSRDDDDEADDDDDDDDEETGLTHAQRKKRRRRRRRRKHMRLDQRVAEDGDVQKTEDRLARGTMLRNIAINAALIGLWYSFSISISVYNKWMFSKSGVGGKEKGLDFHFPLFTTGVHMIIQFSLAAGVLYFFPRFRPAQPPPSTSLDSPPNKPLMTKWFYLSRIGPCGTATALDIGLGNFSLRFISLTFYTMCKSSVLSFVLLFAFLFRLEKPTWALCAIILVMTTGVIMMVAGETAFDALGFLLVMSAAASSGFRWSLTQILLLRNPATGNPFSSIFFLTPVMFLALAALSLPIEGPANILSGIHALAAAKGWFAGSVIMLFPGCLAFLMVAAEFALLQRSSVVTLSVCGIFKEVLTISVASVVFGDELSPINLSGLVVTILSIAGYNYLKWGRMREEAQAKAKARKPWSYSLVGIYIG